MRNLNNGPPGNCNFSSISNALTTGGGDAGDSHGEHNGGGSHGRRRIGRVTDQPSA